MVFRLNIEPVRSYSLIPVHARLHNEMYLDAKGFSSDDSRHKTPSYSG